MGDIKTYIDYAFDDIQQRILRDHYSDRAFPNNIDESHLYPMPPFFTSEKPNTQIFYTMGRRNGKTLTQYKIIKEMLDAGYEFVPVEQDAGHTLFMVRPRKEKR